MNSHLNEMPLKFSVVVKYHQDKLGMYWLPKLHERPYKTKFIAILALALLQSFLNNSRLASLLSNIVSLKKLQILCF